mmetsp:Transcript_34429/g.50042  ORF Transcript_34429/g.50042 Transcript_34429/m.50042 type:complete len:277 (+) Transcript_34429:39-869(+)
MDNFTAARTTLFLLLIQIIISVTLVRSDSNLIRGEEGKKNSTISKWEFCEGCKETVNLYARVSSSRLQEMQSKGIIANSVLESQNLLDGICDHEYIMKYNEFVKFSCIKILEDFGIPFLKHFDGKSSAASVIQKAETYNRKKAICTESKACTNASFDVHKISSKSSKKCQACHIIALDIDTSRRLLHTNPGPHRVTLREFLEDKFCNNLGYNHQPYSWLESTCDEMVEEHIENILGVVRFHGQVTRTGMTPSQTMPEMLCEELYRCSKIKKGSSEL